MGQPEQAEPDLVLTFDYPIQSANRFLRKSSFWAWKKYKAGWRARVAAALLSKGFNLRRLGVDALSPRVHRAQLVIERVYWGKAQELDKDNFILGCKPLIDALVRCRVLVDDTSEWLTCEYQQTRISSGPVAKLKESEIVVEVRYERT